MRLVELGTVDATNLIAGAAEVWPEWNSATAYTTGTTVYSGMRTYQALQNSTNKPPATEPTYWTDIGPSNKWAMFDTQNATQTVGTDSFTVTFDASRRIDTLALLEVDAAMVNVTISQGATEVYNEDFDLVDYDGIANWWDYYFNTIQRRRTLLLTNLPMSNGLTVSVTISGSGNVAVGNLAYGRGKKIGETQMGAQLGFIDYSKFETDPFGRRMIVVRDYKKQGDFDVFVENAYVDRVYRDIIAYRGRPALIIASDAYEATVYFGLIALAKISIAYPLHSILRVQIEDF